MHRLYLDCNAAVPPRPEVREAMAPYLGAGCANAASVHAEGRRAREAVDEAAERVADLAGCDPEEIVFTSGGTEANNLALAGAMALHPEGALVVGAVEHDSVLAAARDLERQGARLAIAAVDRRGRVDLARLEPLLTGEVRLISVMSANNETGVLQPVDEARRMAHARGIRMHTDAAQTLGKIPVDFRAWGGDLMTVSANKIGGPQGVGALIVRRGVELAPRMHGGPQQRGRRGGTENVAGIVGFGESARWAKEGLEREAARQRDWIEGLWAEVHAAVPGVARVGEGAPTLPNTLQLAFEGIEGDSLRVGLDLEGVAVSAGAACDAGATEPSHVLIAMGYPETSARAAIRISIGWATVPEDRSEFLERLRRVLQRARSR